MASGTLLTNDTVQVDEPAPISCSMHKINLTADKEPYEILALLTPLNTEIWEKRSVGWMTVFKIYIGVFAAFYMLLAIMAIVMIYRKDCIRLQTKTFLAVYSIIAVLGFSRTLFLILDPYGLIGFIKDHFARWIIISRFIAALGFPSLVASYTLVFLTLLKLSKTSARSKWYQKWKFVAPIAAIPYVIALGAEIIGNTAPYPALISVIACESALTIFGVLICGVFLFAGRRLTHKIRLQERRTIRLSSIRTGEGENSQVVEQRTNFAAQEYERHHRRFEKTTRKITIITYATALLGILYSIITATNVVVISLFVFYNCLGFRARGSSAAWLILQIGLRSAEIPLALVMFYSITDVTNMVKYIRCNCCRKTRQPVPCKRQTALGHLHLNTSSQSTMGLVESRTTHTSMESVNINAQAAGTESQDATVDESDANPRAFMLNAQGDSESSIETNSATVTAEKYTQTIEQSDKAVQTDTLNSKPSPNSHQHPRRIHHKSPNTASATAGSKFTRKFTV